MRTGRADRRTFAAAAVVVMGLVGVVLVALPAVRPSHPQPPSAIPFSEASTRQGPPPARKPSRVGRTAGGVEDRIAGPVLAAAKPVQVTIPRIRVASRLVPLGVDGLGAMEVPKDPAIAGWYRLGPTPGSLGPAVIAGHVTWNRVPAVFFRLGDLRPGDLVQVARGDDRVAVFEVTRVTRFAKRRFPTRAVFGGIDHAGLRLITCGGTYDQSSHRYRDNVVAFADLVSSHQWRHGDGP